jgi:hypothetical protein
LAILNKNGGGMIDGAGVDFFGVLAINPVAVLKNLLKGKISLFRFR